MLLLLCYCISCSGRRILWLRVWEDFVLESVLNLNAHIWEWDWVMFTCSRREIDKKKTKMIAIDVHLTKCEYSYSSSHYHKDHRFSSKNQIERKPNCLLLVWPQFNGKIIVNYLLLLVNYADSKLCPEWDEHETMDENMMLRHQK